MSFSSETKKELCALKIESKIEALLELSAIARTNASVHMSRDRIQLRFFSESEEVILRIIRLVKFLYGMDIDHIIQQNDQLKQNPVHSTFFEGETLDLFFDQAALDPFGHYTQSPDRILSRLKAEGNSRAYLRGAFLGGGSIVDPHKSYHLEIIVPDRAEAEILHRVFQTMAIESKEVVRRDQRVIYLKDSEMISDCLVDIGASLAMLELENIKVVKDVRNDINRKVNAETANLDKQLDAAFKQIAAIHYIEENGGLDRLAPGLRELALLRLDNPQAKLQELGDRLHPPLSKSGVSHRLRKILRIAEELQEKSNS